MGLYILNKTLLILIIIYKLMKFKKPNFWDYKKPNLFAYILLPFTYMIKLINFFYVKKKK